MLTASCKIEIQKAVDVTYKDLEKLLVPYIESVKKVWKILFPFYLL